MRTNCSPRRVRFDASRVLLVGVIVAAAVVTVRDDAAVAQAQPVVVVEPSIAPMGTEVVARGDGFEPVGTVSIFLDAVVPGAALASVPLTSSSFEATFVLPVAAEGRHWIIACREPTPRGECRQSARANVGLQAPPTSTTTSTTAPQPTVPQLPTTTQPSRTPPTNPTVPPTPPTVPGVIVGEGTTTLPGDLAITTTTVDGSPPAPSVPGHLFATTTLPRPGSFAAGELGDIANLAISHVEVTQGLQSLANEFPLVEGRRTIVRAFGTSEAENGQPAVGAAVAGFRIDGDQQTPLGIEFSENLATFTENDLQRHTHAHSPYIELPESWAEGTVLLRVWVFSEEILAGNEPDDTDNLREVTVVFHETEPLHLWYWPLYLTEDFDPDGDPVIWSTSDGFIPEHLFTYRLWPVSNLWGHPQFTVVGDESSDWDLGASPGAPNAVLRELHLESGLAGNHQYVGMAHPDLRELSTFSGLAGGGGHVASWSFMHLPSNGPAWYHRSGATLAHELGHSYAHLKHAPCLLKPGELVPGESVGGTVDLTFPGEFSWPNCSLAPQDPAGYYGLDVNWELGGASGPTILSNVPTAPGAAFPLMGYKSPAWLDPWHGCVILDALGVACAQTDVVPVDPTSPNQGGTPHAASGGIPAFNCTVPLSEADFCKLQLGPSGDPTANSPGGTTATDDWDQPTMVTGWIDPDAGTAQIVRARAIEPPAGAPSPAGELSGDPAFGGPYVLAVVDEDGVVRWATTIELEDEGDEGEGARRSPQQWFVELVPRIEGATRLLLTSPRGDLATLQPSASAPSLEITGATVTHSGELGSLAVDVDVADLDGDTVWLSAAYRHSPEAPWSPVVGSTTATSFDVDLRDLAGSDHGELQVSATDGYHTVRAVAGGLEVPDQPPTVAIVSPAADRVRPAGRNLDLRVQVLDRNDGPIEDARITWSSDRDGEVATGASASVRDLSEGRHVLTATAVDAAGNVASASVTVEIGPTDLPAPAAVAALATRLGLPGQGDAAPGPGRWSTGQVMVLALGLAGGATGAGAFAIRRRRTV